MKKPKYIAVVEDDATCREMIKDYLEKLATERDCELKPSFFFNAKTFITGYKPNYDMILMDIELPDGNGLELVREIRKVDETVLVIFITNMARYAVKGYEVDAFDFIVKPVTYFNFRVKIGRALDKLARTASTDFWVTSKGTKVRLRTDKLKYVEVMKHSVIYHTTDGDIETVGSMKNAQEQFAGEPFGLCNRCYLVNFAFVEEVRQFSVVVGGEELLMSHLKRAEFLNRLNLYLAGDPCDC